MPEEMDLEERVLAREAMYQGAILRAERWRVSLPSGATASRDVVLHNGACAVIPVDERGYVPMVRQFRVAIGRHTLEIPAGKLDSPDEDPLACAHRELSEECGLTAASMRPLVSAFATPGYCTELLHLYLATGLTKGRPHPDEDEFVAVEWLPLIELRDMARRGELPDMKTALAVLLACDALGV